MNEAVQFVDFDWGGRPVRIEYQWIAVPERSAPLLVFLHEGLGSLSMWKDFPLQLCHATGCRGLVWSRPGYGRSTPRENGETWEPDFLHRQATEVLPALLAALDVRDSVWLLGHSDGGSIALLYAAKFPYRVSGVIAFAPHIFVEDVTLDSIAQARRAYEHGDLRARLTRYHDNPDSAFWGWNRIWLDPRFRAWSIETEIAAIRCPVLAVQGLQDEYGSMDQLWRIALRVPGTELLELPACGHSPHRDQPARVIAAVNDFIHRHQRRQP